MKLLIDSSTNYLILSIIDNSLINVFYREGKCDHSETLMDYLTKFINDNNYTFDSTEEVYIGRGPGSYTGLRIAGTVGKTISYLKNIKLYSFSSLDLILSSIYLQDGSFLASIPAKKNSSYVKGISIKEGIIKDSIKESFIESFNVEDFKEYKLLELNVDFFKYSKEAINNLLNNKLYKEESFFDYSPNYIRSVL